ncbi:hypothetical protein [Nocardioides psychrotolerans]|uniref:hypothetical protein n=1 Tax=Nocardioides psychrotolerans TaxID=1005945 RepID=UPI003137B877
MSTLLRRAGLSSSALVLALSLAACGGDEKSGSTDAGSDAPVVLSQDEADGALLTLEDVGADFTELGPTESDDQDLGCLSGLTALSDLSADTEAENNFELETETSRRSIVTVVNSYADTDTVVAGVEEFRASLDGCETVEVTDPESGTNLALAVTVDEAPGIGETDDQVGFSGTGSVSAPGNSYSYDVSFVVSRVDNALSVVGLIDLAAPGEDVLDSLTETALGRLVDAVG